MDQRILIELINGAFLSTGGSPAEYKVGLDLAIAKGWLWPHESGTQAGAELFAYQASHVQPLVDHWAGKWTLRGAYLHNGPELPTAPA